MPYRLSGTPPRNHCHCQSLGRLGPFHFQIYALQMHYCRLVPSLWAWCWERLHLTACKPFSVYLAGCLVPDIYVGPACGGGFGVLSAAGFALWPLARSKGFCRQPVPPVSRRALFHRRGAIYLPLACVLRPAGAGNGDRPANGYCHLVCRRGRIVLFRIARNRVAACKLVRLAGGRVSPNGALP